MGLINLVAAVFDDEAFVVDWSVVNIGQANDRNIVSPKKDIFHVLTDRNILAGIEKGGNPKWRVKFDGLDLKANQRLIAKDDNLIITGLNYIGRSVIQSWDPYQGFLVKTLHQFDAELLEISTLLDGSIIAVFQDGAITRINTDGEVTAIGSISESQEVKISTLANGNVAILYKELDSNNSHVAFYNGDDLKVQPIPVLFDSIVDFYGSKIVFKTQKYHLIHLNPTTGELSKTQTLPQSEKYLALDTDEYLAFEKNHHIEVLTIDFKPHFIIENVHKYTLKFIESSFVLYTEFHANILDADTGEELKSHLLNERIDHDNVISIHSSSDGVEDIYTLFRFQNNTYSYFLNEKSVWSRDNTLSDVVAHAIVDLPVENTITSDEILYEEGLDILSAYAFRLKRHFYELKDFYNYLWQLLEQWGTGSLPVSSQSNDRYFGFEKLLVTGTGSGRVIALNTLDGSQVWDFATGQDLIIAIENVENEKLYVFTSSGVRFILNATTGELIEKHVIAPSGKIVRLTEAADFLVELEDGFDLILSENQQALENTYFTKNSNSYIEGLLIKNGKTYSTWKFDVKENEEIIGFSSKDPNEAIANIGIILGDRSVLYKYLYPNLASFGVLNKDTKTLYIYIIDTITGEILHSAYHDELVHENEKFNIVFGEHWVVYSYWSNLPTPEQKIAVIDLFESLVPNTRYSGSSNNQSSFDHKLPPAVLSKAFILPSKINSLAISKTKFGVTTKSVIVSLSNGQILNLPKPFLNSRRVQGRELTAAEKQEFLLLPYDPVITADESNIITHGRVVYEANHLISIPTNLESTSIVCSYGLDVFCTRVSPSLQFDKLTHSFDYVKLIGSIVLLFITYGVIKYFNNSKRLKSAWVYED